MSVGWTRLIAVPLGLLAFFARLAADVRLKPLTDGPEPGIGFLTWIVAVLGAVAVPIVLWAVLTHRVDERPKSFTVDEPGRRFVAQRSPDKSATIVITLMWVVSGDHLIGADAPPLALFVAGATLVGLLVALVDRPRLGLTPDGVTVQHLFRRTHTAWADAAGLDTEKRGHLHRFALDRRPGPGGLEQDPQRLPVDSVRIDDTFLAAAVRHYLDNPSHRPAIGTRPELARLIAALTPAADNGHAIPAA
jgi:hypothetical protein